MIKSKFGPLTILLLVYLILLHVIVYMALTKTGLFNSSPMAKSMAGHYYYMDLVGKTYIERSHTLQKNPQIIFIADSMIDRICVESIFRAVNFSITGDTVSNVKDRIKYYQHLEGKFVVLALGINDIPRPTEDILRDYKSILDTLSPTTKIMISSVLPVDEIPLHRRYGIKQNSQIREINGELEKLSAQYKNVYFEYTSTYLMNPDGGLRPDLHIGDGLHLNAEGNTLWIKALKEAMIRISAKDPYIETILKNSGLKN